MDKPDQISPIHSKRAPLAVVYRAIASLRPDPRNARTHPKRQLAQIAASIEAFGFTNPILADEEGQ
jgi:ParB-like chromosome segregation protein Spo0J